MSNRTPITQGTVAQEDRRYAFLRLLIICQRVAASAAIGEVERMFDARDALGDGSFLNGLAKDAEYHGVAPFVSPIIADLAARWPELIPIDVLQAFQILERRHRSAADARDTCIDQIIETFRSAQIPVVLLKGAALAHQIYPHPGMRPAVDIDILVPVHNLTRAADLCKALGFTFASDYESPFTGRHHHLPAARRRHAGYEITLEIHGDVLSPNQAERLSFDDLSAPPQTFQRGERPSGLTLGPVDTLRHLTRHTFEPARRTRLIHLLDLWLYHERFRDSVDWQLIERRYPSVANGLRMTSYIFFDAYDVAPLAKVPIPGPAGVGMGMAAPTEILVSSLSTAGKAVALFDPPAWWLHAFYGVAPEASLLHCRLVRHPARVLRWLGKRLFLGRGIAESFNRTVNLMSQRAWEVGQPAGSAPTDDVVFQIGEQVPVRAAHLEAEEIEGEFLLFDPLQTVASCLNSSAALVFQLCDGVRNTREIVEFLTMQFPEALDRIASDVEGTLNQLKEAGIVAPR